MLEGHDLLVFVDDWCVYPTTTEHLLRRLVERNRSLWVHLIGLRSPQLNLYDLRRAIQKLRHWASSARSRPAGGGPGPAFYSPVMVPFSRSRIARWWNRWSAARGVRERLRRLGMSRPIVVTSLPHAAEVIGQFDERLVAYLCEDEYAEMPGVHGPYVRAIERRLLERADLVFVTSRALVEPKSTKSPAILLPQGVDFDHFHCSRESAVPPVELAALPRPIIGFVGLLASWVDMELLVAVARAHRDASVALIGPARADTERLRAEPNIALLGPRPYTDLARYLAQFDVGLIPFRRTELTRYVNPLKLLEYMASGMPVVSTALPDLATFGDLVYSTDDADEFVAMVGRASREPGDGRRERRVAVARSNSWEARAETMSAHIEQALETPARRGARH